MQWQMPVLKLSRRAGKTLLGIVLALLVLAALAAWQVPRLVRDALTQNVTQLLGRQVAVGKIGFNPFTLTLHVHELTIDQPQSPPLLEVAELDLSAAWRSIVLLAPVVDLVRIVQPKLTLVREDAAHFNFSDIVDKFAKMSADQPASPQPAKPGLPRFSLNNMSLVDGTVSLDDHVTGRKQVVDELELGVPFISTFGYATHIDVQPKVHMRVNGSPFDLTGTARPFDKVPTSTLNVVFSGLELEKWADFWPAPLPVKVQRALLDSNLQILFEQPPDAAPRIRVQGDLGLRQFDVREASGDPLLAWDALQIERVAVDPGEQSAYVGAVRLTGPRVEVHRDAQQQLNWLRVGDGLAKLGGAKPAAAAPAPASASASAAPPAPATNTPPAATPPAAPSWKIVVDDIKLDDGAIHLRDDPFGLDYPLGGLAFEAENVAMPQAAGQPMHVWLDIDNNFDSSWLRLKAPVVLQPLSVNAQIELGNLALAPFAFAVQHFAPMVLQDGRLGMQAKVNVAGTQFEARDVRANLQNLAVHDEALKPPVDVSVASLVLTADRVALDSTPGNFTLQADGLQKQGKLALKGTLVTQPLAVKTSVDLADLDLASLAPFVASSINATVKSLAVAAKGDAEFTAAQGKAPMRAGWRGAVDVNNLDLEDLINKAEFLNWKHLGFTNMDVSVAGEKLGLHLGDILLEDFYGNILLNQDARLNVIDIVPDYGKAGGSITQGTQTPRGAENARKPDEPKKTAEAQPAAPKPKPKPTGNEPDIAISSVTLHRGRMTFNDHFIRPNYRAELSAIEGTLSAVSSTKPMPAKVGVTGKVYGTAPLSVSGTVQPFSDFLALDIKASARGVDLPQFTTYSNKYVGYAIQRGKLSVDLQYQIKDRALQASNKVILNQLTFGKPSNSPDALKLPVLLAVALLKDSSGNIDIDLPISGSLDDPQFSVGGIILRVVMNLLVKAVTSPFKLLAAAFGGGDQDLSYIDFQPGSAALDDKGKSSVGTLVKALNDRPALKMDIIGRADPQADEEGLRQAWVEDQIRMAKAKDVAGRGQKPDPASVTLTPAEYDKYLEQVYDDTKIKDKPRNFIGMAKSIPPDQMNALLRGAAPLDQQALRNLADARARAVYEALQAESQTLTNRVFVVAPKLDAEGIEGGGKATRVDFALQ